jgi:uncharacterized protein (TIGR02271 family)
MTRRRRAIRAALIGLIRSLPNRGTTVRTAVFVDSPDAPGTVVANLHLTRNLGGRMATSSNPLVRLSDDDDLEIAPNEPDVRGWSVKTSTGQNIGKVADIIVDRSAMKVRCLEVNPDGASSSGTRPMIPIEAADLDRDDRAVIIHGLTAEQIRALPAYGSGSGTSPAPQTYQRPERASNDSRRLTRAEEEVRIGKRSVQAGEVRVGKHVETERVQQPVTLERERITVERRPVTDPGRTDVRIGDQQEIVVPVMEEQAVVEKRPVVKEELVIAKERVTETEQVETEVRKERFDIDDNAQKFTKDKGGR